MRWLQDGSGRILLQGVREAAVWDPAADGDWQFITPAASAGRSVTEVQNASANADATLLAFSTYGDWLYIHDLATGAEKARFRHNPDSPQELLDVYPLWSPADPDRILTYRTRDDDPEKQIHVWNSRGEKQFSVNLDGDSVSEAAWSPDGQYILCADAAGRLRIYSADGGALTAELAERPFRTRYCTWSPDGARIAFYADSDYAWIWNWQTDGGVTQIRDPEKHAQSNLRQPSWSPDGTLLYLYSEIYNADSGVEVMALPDDAFSPFRRNGRRMAAGYCLRKTVTPYVCGRSGRYRSWPPTPCADWTDVFSARRNAAGSFWSSGDTAERIEGLRRPGGCAPLE
jgi:hypothetical protein